MRIDASTAELLDEDIAAGVPPRCSRGWLRSASTPAIASQCLPATAPRSSPRATPRPPPSWCSRRSTRASQPPEIAGCAAMCGPARCSSTAHTPRPRRPACPGSTSMTVDVGDASVAPDPAHAGATLLYTSGTTGRPKACLRAAAQEPRASPSCARRYSSPPGRHPPDRVSRSPTRRPASCCAPHARPARAP